MTHGLGVADSGRKLWLFLEVRGFTDTSCKNLNSAFEQFDLGVLFSLQLVNSSSSLPLRHIVAP